MATSKESAKFGGANSAKMHCLSRFLNVLSRASCAFLGEFCAVRKHSFD